VSISTLLLGLLAAQDRGAAWTRHTIDAGSRGADGVRLADANGDGLLDFVTGWEQGGVSRLYLNPGPAKAKQAWTQVTVGEAKDAEDAVLVDLDGDGAMDVVSSCEGGARTVFVHWAPREKERLLDPAAWRTEPIPASVRKQQWMYCVPLQVDGRRGIDLVCAGKNKGAEIGWFESPEDPRRLADWTWHPLSPAGWVMTLLPVDLDEDGDLDLLLSDRKGPHRGVRWLENPGRAESEWKNRFIAGQDREVMFLSRADADGDGKPDLVVAVREAPLLLLRAKGRLEWEPLEIPMPPNTGGGKAASVGDLDGDGKPDFVVSCEGATGAKSGVFWLRGGAWEPREISGPAGTKFDLVPLLDVDGDGDLDVLACEEIENLGVFWYENPSK
jgi:hypothetical protein